MKYEKYERADIAITEFGKNDVIATSVDSDRAIRSTYEVKPLELWTLNSSQ